MSRLRTLEALGVVSGLSYTLLITEGIVWCWLFALISSTIYLYLCFKKRIYAESLLQLFYLFAAVYGWVHWNENGGELGLSLSWKLHAMVILSGGALVLLSGYLLRSLSDAATPFVDSFTTVFAVFATLMMINLIPDNWYYWIVIDSVSIWLYLNRRLYLTAALFLVYTILAINGLIQWVY